MKHDGSANTSCTHSTTSSTEEVTDAESSWPQIDWSNISCIQSGATGCLLLVVLVIILITVPPVSGDHADTSSPISHETSISTSANSLSPVYSPNQQAISGEFTQSTYTGVAGDPIEITHGFDPDGDTYLLIGGNRISDTGQPVGFVDVIKLDGTSTTINTRLIGTDESTVESCGLERVSCDLEFRDTNGNVIADSLSNLSASSGATGAGGLVRPLVPQRYRLAITDGKFTVDDSGVVTPTAAADQADLVLKKPTLRNSVEVSTSIDPAIVNEDINTESLAELRENGLDRTTVTEGNHVILGFESTGIWGALSYFAADSDSVQAGEPINAQALSDLIAAEEGVSLQIQQTNPTGNEPRSELDLSQTDTNDVTLILADGDKLNTPDAPSQFYLVLNTGDDGPFTHNPEPGDTFAVEFALEGVEGDRYRFNTTNRSTLPAAFDPVRSDGERSEQFPYWGTSDDGMRAEASFTIRERFVRYNHVSDEGEILVEAENGRISGTTSLLPATETSATLVNDASDAPYRKESQLQISDDNFSVNFDTDGLAPGTRLNYNLYQGSIHRDSRTAVIVGDSNNPDRLVIENAPKNVTVTEGRNLSAIGATARNIGGLPGKGELTLTVNNGTVSGSWGVRLDPNKSQSFKFSSVTPDLDPGTYPFTLRLDGDTHGGTLTVEEDPATTTIDDDATDADGNETDVDGDGSEADPDGEGDGADEGDGSDEADEDEADDGDESDDGDDGTDSPGADSDGDAPADEGSDSVGMLPLPFGTREAFGGTVLVGAVHLLGHWV
ncbi:BGTF surface domain-containing protein [Halorubrum xinjiangense]|uniref:BGTF surface domain-containing protein n=1 Tax=Halorubrum xinjiangense TaxID=261291 RepID=UPI003C6FB17F